MGRGDEQRSGAVPGVSTSGDEALEGAVERVTFYNPENGFSVVQVRVRGRREPIAVVGTLPAVQPGETLALRGRWQTDPRHGAQFRPATAEVRPPSARDDVIRYLGSGLIRQLGPTLARRIADHFGDETLAILDARPERVREVPGIGPQRAAALAAAWADHRALREVSAFLSAHGLNARYAPRLVAAYGADAPRVLAANPYRLVAEVAGLGFAAADRLGSDLGVRPTAPARLQAAVHAALLRAGEAGHTRQARGMLAEAAARLADTEVVAIEPAIAQLLASGVIAARGGDEAPQPAPAETLPLLALAQSVPAPEVPAPSRVGGLRIYEPPPAASADDGPGLGLRGLVRAEESLAARLRALAGRPGPLSPAIVDRWLAGDADARGLSDEQRAAVRAAATSGLFVLTGGPGVGKTTTVRALVRCLAALGRSVALAAPTGKAAKRLGDVVGLEARTIHRLLGAGPQGFRHGAREPLPFDAIVVDEASMLDTQLARAVVAAVGPRAQLILVGDADQLPSVGPGQVLRDILDSGRVPAATLTTIFRQAAVSVIVRGAHRIRLGELPELAPPGALGRESDCVFVPVAPDRVAAVAAEWAAERLPRHLGRDPREVQALAPLTRVCQALNAALQDRLNPSRGQDERPHGALPLRAGDRVIQTRNNYNLGVVNGDTGIVAAVAPGEVVVDFGDGREIVYAPADLIDLDHAYCLTVHRAQGSEWPGVVLLVSSGYGPMLSRNLLYTALTRAKGAAVIVGDEAAIARAVAETRDRERRTGLAALLAAEGV
jgi:exodeoxyribonuclease V alpha subunit